jgi:hypothetical protein
MSGITIRLSMATKIGLLQHELPRIESSFEQSNLVKSRASRTGGTAVKFSDHFREVYGPDIITSCCMFTDLSVVYNMTIRGPCGRTFLTLWVSSKSLNRAA